MATLGSRRSLTMFTNYRSLNTLASKKQSFFKNGIFYDNRKPGEREVINPAWIPKNGKGSLRVERVDEKDFDLIGSFYNYHFVNYGNMWKAIGAKYEDTEQMAFDALSIAIKKPASYAVFDGDQLIGFHINRIHTADEFPQFFEGKLFDSNPKFEYKSDYAYEIENGKYNPTAEKINVILSECLKQVGKFLPSDLTNLGYMKASGTRPDYTNNGLLYYLFIESLKDYQKYNCNYFIGFCLAANSYKMCRKIGMNEAFCFPYSEYKANGKQVFENLYDGATGVHVMIGRVDTAMDILTGKRPPASHL